MDIAFTSARLVGSRPHRPAQVGDTSTPSTRGQAAQPQRDNQAAVARMAALLRATRARLALFELEGRCAAVASRQRTIVARAIVDRG